MAWDIGADELASSTVTRTASVDALLRGTELRTASVDAYLQGQAGGVPGWDIGADEITGGAFAQVSLDAVLTDLSQSQLRTLELGAAIAPSPPSGVSVDNAGVSWIAMSFTDNSGGTAYHHALYRKSTDSTYSSGGMLWHGDTDFTFRYLDSGTTYVLGFAAVSDDGVHGNVVTVSQATDGGAETTADIDALLQGTPALTCSVSAYVTGATAPVPRRVSGRFV